ncbi:PTS lactose/cellobiose transporter subunit IIA [Thermoanaerobacter wiegelii]|uniref:Phosphotransferase system PTS lactose/cellobiose-specific IIA subunit n=1 Tax=Thermoanaerobacter wiegelii Rt8.B1 TaxID=697303 RepID=G2MUW1_9THEO|nr:PTS lactose/cellobiose transporter subunit IIA [Thermoanaerobacter wiegelii]AEM77862.1 phosphotransferase system PTS lactose/cellobiose-specific IIA subunit [Thermoanaerobacter wiegelii Rt8.B1]
MSSEEIIFQMILHGGNARTEAYEALKYAKVGDFETAQRHIEAASEELHKAHQVQADIIQKEAAGGESKITLLMVHAQDHVMTAMAEKNLIERMVDLYKLIYENMKKNTP